MLIAQRWQSLWEIQFPSTRYRRTCLRHHRRRAHATAARLYALSVQQRQQQRQRAAPPLSRTAAHCRAVQTATRREDQEARETEVGAGGAEKWSGSLQKAHCRCCCSHSRRAPHCPRHAQGGGPFVQLAPARAATAAQARGGPAGHRQCILRSHTMCVVRALRLRQGESVYGR